MDEIQFHGSKGEYGCFSNFAPCPFSFDGKMWPTSEHFFQAQKFAGSDHEETIRRTKSPMIAARLGRSRKVRIRKDWESVKVEIMRRALDAKFRQNEPARRVLLGTGGARIVEHTERDRFWGDGGDGSGRNMLGQLLMELREKLAEELT